MRPLLAALGLLSLATLAQANWQPDHGYYYVTSDCAYQEFVFLDNDLPPDIPYIHGFEQELVIFNQNRWNLTFPRFAWSNMPDPYLDCGPQEEDNDSFTMGSFLYPNQLEFPYTTYISLNDGNTSLPTQGQLSSQLTALSDFCQEHELDDCYCRVSWGETAHLAYFQQAASRPAHWQGDHYCFVDDGSFLSHGNNLDGTCWHFEDSLDIADKNGSQITVHVAGDYRSVRLWQQLSSDLVDGKAYRLRQSASSADDMPVRIGFEDGAGNQLGEPVRTRFNDWGGYIEYIIYPHETIESPRLVYYFGEGVGTCWLTNVRLEETDYDPPPPPPPPPSCVPDPNNLLSNGSFDGTRCWSIQDPDHRADFDFMGRLHAAIDPGPWNSVLATQPVSLDAGATYAVFFDVHGSEESTITVGCENPNHPGQVYGLWQDIGIGPTPRRVWEVFTSPATDAKGHFFIAMGAVSGEIWIDDVVIRRVECHRELGQLLGDPDFETLDCWRPFHYPKPDDQFAVETDEHGTRRLVVTSSGEGQFWHTQLYQPDIPIERGKRYLLSQTIETDGPMDIFTAIANGDNQVLGAWDALHVTPGHPIPIESMAFTVPEDASTDGAKPSTSLARTRGPARSVSLSCGNSTASWIPAP